LFLVKVLFMLLRGLLHGFGALLRWLWQDKGVRALLWLAVICYFFQRAEAKSRWFGKDEVVAYNLTNSDFTDCPPGHRLNPNPLQRLNPLAPNCIPVKQDDEVWFGEDISTVLSQFAIAGLQSTAEGVKMKGWLDWMKSAR